jgi:hypothetical protein
MIAAGLNLNIDYSRMSAELLAIQSKATAFSYPANASKEIVTAYSLFLRVSSESTAYSYRGAKSADFDSWTWDEKLDIPYTRSVIESIPYTKLGTVRIVYFPNVPCMEHTDWDDADDTEHTLGLSIIPSTGNTYCNVWSEKLQNYVAVPGNAMLLNDSIKHWVPKSEGTRITMRVFGEINLDWFNDKIDYGLYYS